MEDIILNPEDMLVSPLEDYYTKTNIDTINLTLKKDVNIEVGIIEHIGSEIPKDWLGKVIYYHSDVATGVNIRDYGYYWIVPVHLKILVRLDQNKNNC